jgi:thioredoxin 1
MSKLIDTEQELDRIKNSPNGVLVLYYASWCPYSQEFLPLLEKYARARPKNCFRVLTDRLENAEEEYNIEVVPTVLFFRNGKVVKRLNGEPHGGLDERQLVEMLESCDLATAK